MKITSKSLSIALIAVFAAAQVACGGSTPKAQTADDDEDYDVIGSIVGDVEIDEADLEDDEVTDEAYTGTTKVTINLRVVNERNPEGSYRLMDTTGTVIIENGKLGEEVALNQGVYSVEFATPLVFGKPKYLLEDFEVAGKKMTLDQVFPAGQTVLHTYRGKREKKCVPTSFVVYSDTLEKELDGKGKTCEPLILETGAYELRLHISKKAYQPVKMRINAEQSATARVKLEK